MPISLDHLAQGNAAIRRSDWPSAGAAFRAALALEETAEALEGLAFCELLSAQHGEVMERHRRAYSLYLERGDRVSAARIATLLGVDVFELEGRDVIASGWFARAHDLLAGMTDSLEYGWLRAWEAHVLLMQRNDTAFARAGGREAVRVSALHGDIHLEVLGTALEGLALVSEGHIDEGMHRLETASVRVIAGDIWDANIAISVGCYLIDACSRIRDFERANQWCPQFIEVFARLGLPEAGWVCRPLYAVVLMWSGNWARAESELEMAIEEVRQFRPAMITESLVRKAELRCRQGRLDEADALFREVELEPLSQVGRAHLAMLRGDLELATDLLARFLRRIPLENRVERVGALELAVTAALARDDVDIAWAHLAELDAAAQSVGTPPLRAAATVARASISAHVRDLPAARACFEAAIDILGAAGAPYESAQARIGLAETLDALGRTSQAMRERLIARDLLRGIGSVATVPGLEETLAAAAELPAPRVIAGPGGETLTDREVEILRLVARGRSNQEIADTLVLSVRTVERHITTVYAKLGISGRVARASATAYAIEHGLLAVPV